MKINSAEFFISASSRKGCPDEGLPEVAFVGKSNVGKSSLINTILNRKKLAKTSSTPGRTQLINYFLINENTFFVDLPGYGFAKVAKEKKKGWGKMMEDYLADNPNLRAVVLILDIRRLVAEEDFELVDFLYAQTVPIIYVLTKCDKVSNNEIFRQKAKLKKELGEHYNEELFILFSALTRRGKEDVLDKIDFYLGGSAGGGD